MTQQNVFVYNINTEISKRKFVFPNWISLGTRWHGHWKQLFKCHNSKHKRSLWRSWCRKNTDSHFKSATLTIFRDKWKQIIENVNITFIQWIYLVASLFKIYLICVNLFSFISAVSWFVLFLLFFFSFNFLALADESDNSRGCW